MLQGGHSQRRFRAQHSVATLFQHCLGATFALQHGGYVPREWTKSVLNYILGTREKLIFSNEIT